ncbi:MAG: adenine deaminase [Clostridia bacterium]|nr:adenine deaminase [Clostridia bacterium]
MVRNETISQRIERKIEGKQRVVAVARGDEKPDLVLKNATYLNMFSNEFLKADIAIAGGLIVGIGEYYADNEIDVEGKVICPGFIDAHIHLESSLVTPSEFAKAVVSHGTTTVITDPHEIANVMGIDGINYMLESTYNLPIDVHFMLPSCVPATPMDESGADLDYLIIDHLYEHPRVIGLAEMMNFEGVINGDEECLEKILGSQAHHLKIDGHAPGLSGNRLNAYISAGVYSDHECFDYDNALEKLRKGQFIMIREGTAAHNLEALAPLISVKYHSRCMFATDDKHPNDLLEKGHIDYIVNKAVEYGVNPLLAIKIATHEAARYFNLNNKGAIAPGYLADIVVLDKIEDFKVEKVFKKGKLVYSDGKVADFEVPEVAPKLIKHAHNTFNVKQVVAEDFKLGDAPVIGLTAGELLTTDCGRSDKIDVSKDILKVAVVERHKGTGHIGLSYINGYGMKEGAVATSISHDSHNIIAVGTNDEDIALAVNEIVKAKGGICVVKGGKVIGQVELAIAGLMSEEPLEVVNAKLEEAKAKAFELGVPEGIDPFMTLSFISLPVIPALRVTTTGVFDVNQWKYVK